MTVSTERPAECPTISTMPDTRQSPTLRRRRLAARMKALRVEQDGRSGKEVAEALDWHPTKISVMERNEWRLPKVGDVRQLLDEYGVTDEREREELITLAREGRQRGWWHPYSKMLSETYTTYIGLEAGAASVLNFEPGTIPGLLQTEGYARALIAAGPAELSDELIEDRVRVRLKRQELLTQDDPIHLSAVIDEAAIRRLVGGSDVMRRQLAHLVEVAQRPRVTLQVIPFEAGAHAGSRGPFHILQFPDAEDLDAVYVDNVAGELFVEHPDQVRRFDMAFRKLLAVAMSPRDTINLISTTANR